MGSLIIFRKQQGISKLPRACLQLCQQLSIWRVSWRVTNRARYRPDRSFVKISQIINASYQDLMEYKTDQSLLISGESGAGKTVTVKVCLEFISEIAGSGDNGIEQKILASNPILESFGNAKTVRNDNSSRFGKFMEVHFDTIGTRQIIGCNMVNYLLEKSRVVSISRASWLKECLWVMFD